MLTHLKFHQKLSYISAIDKAGIEEVIGLYLLFAWTSFVQVNVPMKLMPLVNISPVSYLESVRNIQEHTAASDVITSETRLPVRQAGQTCGP